MLNAIVFLLQDQDFDLPIKIAMKMRPLINHANHDSSTNTSSDCQKHQKNAFIKGTKGMLPMIDE